MKNTLSLNELIAQLKKDLMAEMEFADSPLFFVESVEVEVAVSISGEGKAGINIQVLDIGGSVSREHANVVRVKLSPILSREELQSLIKKSPQFYQKIENLSTKALMKGDIGIAGESE